MNIDIVIAMLGSSVLVALLQRRKTKADVNLANATAEKMKAEAEKTVMESVMKCNEEINKRVERMEKRMEEITEQYQRLRKKYNKLKLEHEELKEAFDKSLITIERLQLENTNLKNQKSSKKS